jgi:hypothetical protein
MNDRVRLPVPVHRVAMLGQRSMAVYLLAMKPLGRSVHVIGKLRGSLILVMHVKHI